MIPLLGGSFLNAGGGSPTSFSEDDDRDEVDRLETDADVGIRRRGGGESGCMGTILSRLPEPLTIFGLTVTLARSRGGGVSPPSG